MEYFTGDSGAGGLSGRILYLDIHQIRSKRQDVSIHSDNHRLSDLFCSIFGDDIVIRHFVQLWNMDMMQNQSGYCFDN